MKLFSFFVKTKSSVRKYSIKMPKAKTLYTMRISCIIKSTFKKDLIKSKNCDLYSF